MCGGGGWKGKRVMNYISTDFSNDMVTSMNRVNLKKTKAPPIVTYIHFMNEVDRSDYMIRY